MSQLEWALTLLPRRLNWVSLFGSSYIEPFSLANQGKKKCACTQSHNAQSLVVQSDFGCQILSFTCLPLIPIQLLSRRDVLSFPQILWVCFFLLWIYESRRKCSNTLSLKITYVTLNINDIFDRTIIHISKDRFLAWRPQQTIRFAIASKALMFQLLDAIIWSQKYSQNSELRGQCKR